jgi:hypothetical protein
MNSRTWTLIAVVSAVAPAAGAADMRVVADDAWCREGLGDWHGGRGRHCEVREATWRAAGPVKADARPNGGIQAKGWDRNEVRARVRVSATGATVDEARALAAQVRVDTDGGIRVTGPETRNRERQWWVGIRLDVPRDAELDLEADNGGIHIEDFSGKAKFSTVNGGIHLDGVGGDIQGRTVNGGLHVNLGGSEWDGEGLDVTTTNGGVHLEIPAGYNAHLETGTVNGGIHSDVPVTTGRRRGHVGGRIEADLGRGGRPLRLETTNGGLHVNTE